ncbi:MAG: glucuronosyltransferase [Devosia sp.]|nr:glucuronosyltransferase [Devosia sp.]
MILVSVGLLLPFDRLIALMDDWAAHHADIPVMAQIGDGRYLPRHMQWQRQLEGPAFRSAVQRARLVVAHAGIGTIFDALGLGKPLVLVPRYADSREHTTDHQLHTAKRLRGRPGVAVCERGEDIDRHIGAVAEAASRQDGFSPHAPPQMLARLRAALLA